MINRSIFFAALLPLGLPVAITASEVARSAGERSATEKSTKTERQKKSNTQTKAKAPRRGKNKASDTVQKKSKKKDGAQNKDAVSKDAQSTDSTPQADKPKVLTEWEPDLVLAERTRCQTLLADIQAITMPEKGFRKGKCGAAAPVRLVAVGQSPQVVLSPPAVMTCRLAKAVHQWVTGDLQKLAKKHLGDQIIQIEVMSDYACRNVYGRLGGNLSEHALANALDVRGFVTARGDVIRLLKSWGPTARDIAAEKARIAEAEQARRDAQKKAQAEAEIEEQEKDNQSADVGRKNTKTLVVKSTKRLLKVGDKLATAAKTVLKAGVRPKPDLLPLEKRLTNKGRFLRAAHKSACRIFGTTLGPEANNAHRNHFHLDMRPRKRSNYCE